jgi:TolA-binding protein
VRRLAIAAALLLISAGIGAVVAALVTGGDRNAANRIVTRRIHETVTQHQTVTAPAPPPPPATVASGSSGHALNDRAYELIRQGNHGGAIPLLQQAIQKLAGTGPADPYEGYANYNLGYALYRSGRCGEAVQYFQRAIRLEPDRSEPPAYLRRAQRCS